MLSKKLFFQSILSILIISTVATATHYYVGPNGDDDANGTSWATAFETIQNGIDVAIDGDIVEVNEGTYYETITFDGNDITLTGTNPYDWDVVEATIIDGNNGLVDAVNFNSNESNDTLFTGFTVSRAYRGINCTNSSPTISRCLIKDNQHRYGSTGIHLSGGTPVVENCKIFNNDLQGIYCGSGSSAIIKNNFIFNHERGIILVVASVVKITNNTIVNNSSFGIYKTGPQDPEITNCILWNSNEFNNDLIDCSATYSCIKDINDANGIGNITSDPCFVDADANDFHLLPISPCINAGDPNTSGIGEKDIDNTARKQNCRVDMGSDEVDLYGNGALYILDSNDYMAALFDENGNLYIRGTLDSNTTPSATTEDEFRVQDSNSSDIAIIDANDGNMEITGQLYERQTTLDPNTAENNFIVKDNDGNTVAYIDEDGNVYLKGTLYENTPDDFYFLPDSRLVVLNNSWNDKALFDVLGNLLLAGDLNINTTPSATTVDELRIQDSNSNDIAVIDANNGSMYIEGAVYENQATLSPSTDDNLIIVDNDGNAISYIDEDGNLYLKGSLYEQRLK